MQFAPNGDLHEHAKKQGPFDEAMCKVWVTQTLSAMVYIHERDIAHRDLKLGNLLLDECHDVLVTDFGLSRVKDIEEKELEARTYCGAHRHSWHPNFTK